MMGMVMGTAYRVKGTGQYLTKDQVDFSGGSVGAGQPHSTVFIHIVIIHSYTLHF